MKRKVMTLAMTSAIAMSMAGCSSGSQPSGQASAAPSEASASETASTSDHADKVTVAVFSQFTNFDPATNGELVNGYVLHHLYANMFSRDGEGIIQNDLCTDYDISEDGLTHTFTLRDDAVWSDGTPVTANDFVYAYLRALSYGTDAASQIYNMTTFIEGAEEYNLRALEAGDAFDCTVEDHSDVGIEAPDDHTLVLTLKMPCTYMTTLMTSGAWTPLPQTTPQHTGSWAMGTDIVTSGAYTMTEMNPNDKCVIVKSDSFYNADQITMPEIVWQVVPDMEAEHLAFQAGDIDVATSISSDTAVSYKGMDELWVAELPQTYCLIINTGEKGPEWAKDVRVRKALAKAIDQSAIVDVIGGEEFYPVLKSYMPIGLEGVNGDFRKERDEQGGYDLEYNPDEAMDLLAQAGYDESNPLKIEYYYSTNSIHNDVATCLQQMWSAVGVETTFKAVESGVYYEGWYNGEYEIARYGVALTHPVLALNTFTTEYQRVATVADEDYDNLVKAIAAEPDPDTAIQMAHEAEDLLVDERVHLIPMFQFTLPMLVNPALKKYEAHGSYVYFGHSSW
ncbi:MAG: peptide ABC transporter substrate-binding protein [Erysipelotrichaceae bacterium]|nr:peptide ABC transporter substrate-binding protein [Erysipelotrichaceae bacterium]